MSGAPTKEPISDDRLRNTRAWADARPDMSGSGVIVGAIDELLAARARIAELETAVTPRRDESTVEWCERIFAARRKLGLAVPGSFEAAERAAAPPDAARDLANAVQARRDLSAKIRAMGMPPHTDYWCQSIDEAEARITAALAAVTTSTKSAACPGYASPRLSLQELPCARCGRLQAEHSDET